MKQLSLLCSAAFLLCNARTSPESFASQNKTGNFRITRVAGLLVSGLCVLAFALPPSPASAQPAHGQRPTVTEEPPVPIPLAGVCEEEFDRNGNIWIEEAFAGAYARLNPATGQIAEYLQLPGSLPGGLELGWDGGVWSTLITLNELVRIDPNTGTFSYYPIPYFGVLQADDITKGADGAMWFNMPGINAIGRFDLNTGQFSDYQIPTSNIPGVNGVGVDGILHIISHGPNNTIMFAEPLSNKIATFNVFTKTFAEYTVPTPLSIPIGVTEGADGNIWFTESATHKFGRINPTTGVITEWDVLQLRGSLLPPGIGNPIPMPGPMKLGADGDIYFSEIQGGAATLTDVIARFNPTTGVFTEIPVPTPLSSPGCDLNNQDLQHEWFGELTGNRIGYMTLDGGQNAAAVSLLSYYSGFQPYPGHGAPY
jgi:virginiamycin B lyase